jgi:hypothetical protein
MAISSYPRTIKNGQIASNGDANAGTGLMLWDSATNTYIAATPSTFAGGAGGATAALQTTLNNLVSTKANQISDAAALAAGTNGGVLVDTFTTQVLSVTMTALTTSQACKTVTLINLSTNVKFTYCISGGTALSLEAGYSVKINVANSSNVQIRQSTGENETCEIIITS